MLTPVRKRTAGAMRPDNTASAEHLVKDDLIPDARLRAGDVDAFRHLPIAARVAEVAVHAEPPVNIALFGPWGSGKSSFFELLRTELKHRDAGIALVRYDAWKYGGGALKRNFISSAATELGMKAGKQDAHKFHLGLYESKRTVRFEPTKLFRDDAWKTWLMVVIVALAFTTVCVAVLATWTAAFTDNDSSDEVARLAPGIAARVGALLLALGAALRVLDGAKVEAEQVVPSEDEQFADLFRDLVDEATKRRLTGTTVHRLVFFVDELDRCSKEDVVSTLSSLRTFLDQRDCIFVVAADREVLEEALDAVPQATPVREEEPYYSSASAFLDKIFQHQFALPPLRGGRLTGFARELVEDRNGIWKDLRDANALDRVLYTLIPSHVRAPRRVKVLLNNFATNARVTEARGIDWLGRAEELAKLTVLQTEFPRLAADLFEEPRLLAMLLEPPADQTDRQRLLLARHRIIEEINEESVDDEYEAPDRLLTADDSTALLGRQREDLHRYLQSRAAPDPGRDLLYLEGVGDWVGLDDPELNRLIEDEAPTRPDRVIDALVDRPVTEQLAAARLLGHLSEREFGPERRNMVTALCRVLATSNPDELDDLGDLLANVKSFRAEQEPTATQLPGLLVLAVAAGEHGRELAGAVFASEALLETRERLALVSRLLPQLRDEDARGVELAVAEAFPEQPEVLLGVIAEQPVATVSRLIATAADALVQALGPIEAPAPAPAAEPGTPAAAATAAAADEDAVSVGPGAAAVEALTDRLLEALDERGNDLLDAKAHLLAALLDGAAPGTYGPCRQRGPDVAVQIADPNLRNQILLEGIVAGPGSDWHRWSEQLVEDPNGREDNCAEEAIMAVLTAVPTEPPDVQATAHKAVQDILRADSDVRADGKATTEKILPTVTSHLASADWWMSDAATTAQSTVYGVAQILAERFGGDLSSGVEATLLADIARADPALVAWDADIAGRFALLASTASAAIVAEADRLAATAAGDGVLLARLRIAERSRALGGDVPDFAVADVIAAGSSGSGGDAVTSTWLRLDPPSSSIAQVLRALTSVRSETKQTLRRRAAAMSPPEATSLLLALVDADADREWVEALGPYADAAVALEGLSERMTMAGGTKREALARAVGTLTMRTQTERQVVGQMALDLLADPNRAKAEVAATLIAIVSSERYGLKTQVKEAVLAADARDKLGHTARRRFESSGLITPRRKKRKILNRLRHDHPGDS